jgi:hypothetical protein
MGKRFPRIRPGEPGVCRFCGCSHFDPCPEGCAWADQKETLCTECTPAAEAERSALRSAPIRNGALRGAFHRGFIVGWFAVVRRQGKKFVVEANPYLAPAFAAAWTKGHMTGFAARRTYLKKYGPILNERAPVHLPPGGRMSAEDPIVAAVHQHETERLLAQMATELRVLEEDGPLGLIVTPTRAFQLIGVLQLALRHPDLPDSARAAAEEMVESLSEIFTECPGICEVIARGNDPNQDVPTDARPRIVIP